MIILALFLSIYSKILIVTINKKYLIKKSIIISSPLAHIKLKLTPICHKQSPSYGKIILKRTNCTCTIFPLICTILTLPFITFHSSTVSLPIHYIHYLALTLFLPIPPCPFIFLLPSCYHVLA